MTVTASANGQTAFLVQVVTAGIGKVCNEVSNLRFSYEGAWEALSYRVIYGSGCSINIADIAPKAGTFHAAR